MGCDIHLYKEKKVNGQWVTADSPWVDEYQDGDIDVPYSARYSGRDYDLFGFLCSGVRRDHEFSFKERGLPSDVCDEVNLVFERWGVDGHSHSYIYLSELKSAWNSLKEKKVTVTGMKHKDSLGDLIKSIESNDETDWMLLYPYCEWSNHPDYVDFSIDIPATFKLDGVENIIGLFDGCDGDDHRIVFWFDN